MNMPMGTAGMMGMSIEEMRRMMAQHSALLQEILRLERENHRLLHILHAHHHTHQ